MINYLNLRGTKAGSYRGCDAIKHLIKRVRISITIYLYYESDRCNKSDISNIP